jgi:hypothetical protein
MMIREFVVPFAVLSCAMVASVVCLNQLCQFYQIFQATSARLQGERWLLAQCEDPHFFSRMHVHTDLCFTVENNARVGVLMLSLREFTQSLLGGDSLFLLGGGRAWFLQRLLSWPGLLGLAVLLLFGPSWLMCGCRSFQQPRRWQACRDAHFKDA